MIFLAECRRLVDAELDELVPSAEVEPMRLHQAVRWSLFAGGKRFRPALCFAVGRSFAVPFERLLRVAAALEMIHTYSLIHDDLPAMDDDDLRRGVPTCHVKFGEATAILAGDALQTLAFAAIAEDDELQASVRARLIAELARAAGTPSGMIAGQQFDLEATGKAISAAELTNIHRRKTGAMIEAAARMAAIVGGASESELTSVTNYGGELGLLFQITDDVLDVTATAAELGKTPGKDASAAKATYVSLYGLDGANRLARESHNRICSELKALDRSTELLREIADYILKRKA